MDIKAISTADMVKEYMDANGISGKTLANTSGVSARTVYRFLNNESRLSKKIAEGLHSLIPEISLDFLMTYDAKYQLQKPTDNIRENVRKTVAVTCNKTKSVRKYCTIPLWLCLEAEKANINFSKTLQNALKRELGR